VSYQPTGDPNYCSVVVNVTGFAPQQTFPVVLTGRQGALSQTWQSQVMTDANGAGGVTPFSFIQVIPTTFEATVDGVFSGAVPVSC